MDCHLHDAILASDPLGSALRYKWDEQEKEARGVTGDFHSKRQFVEQLEVVRLTNSCSDMRIPTREAIYMKFEGVRESFCVALSVPFPHTLILKPNISPKTPK